MIARAWALAALAASLSSPAHAGWSARIVDLGGVLAISLLGSSKDPSAAAGIHCVGTESPRQAALIAVYPPNRNFLVRAGDSARIEASFASGESWQLEATVGKNDSLTTSFATEPDPKIFEILQAIAEGDGQTRLVSMSQDGKVSMAMEIDMAEASGEVRQFLEACESR